MVSKETSAVFKITPCSLNSNLISEFVILMSYHEFVILKYIP